MAMIGLTKTNRGIYIIRLCMWATRSNLSGSSNTNIEQDHTDTVHEKFWEMCMNIEQDHTDTVHEKFWEMCIHIQALPTLAYTRASRQISCNCEINVQARDSLPNSEAVQALSCTWTCLVRAYTKPDFACGELATFSVLGVCMWQCGRRRQGHYVLRVPLALSRYLMLSCGNVGGGKGTTYCVCATGAIELSTKSE